MCTQKDACSQDLLAQMQAGIILSTCNRTEVYSVEPPEHPGGPETLKRLLSDWSEMDLQSDRACLESRRGLEAVRHLFRVASGLESMALGEPEILGQIRRVKENAKQRKWSNPTLDRIFQQAIRVGRRVRAETGIGKGAASLPAAAAGVILERAKDARLEGCLILGSGDVALRIARALKAKRLPGITLCGRKSERAAVLAEEMGIESLPWSSLNGQVSRFRVIVGATIAEVPVLSVGQVAEDTLLVDLGIPRNFHPNLKTEPGVTLYDLDDLKELVEDSNAARQQYIPDAEAIIDEELCHLTQWFRAKEKG
jgi:glutamyl-tRNA reductase